MSALRKLVLLTCAIPVVGLAGVVPAWASFTSTGSLPQMQVSTLEVAAPGNVQGSVSCFWNWTFPSVSWQASTSPGVSGYLVTMYFSDGRTQTATQSPNTTNWTSRNSIGSSSVRYSVTTLTSYGWTKESATTGWSHC